jgi:ATP-dependent helicase/nuclease subunit A
MIRGGEQLVWGPNTGWRAGTCGDIALLFQASSGFEYYEEALRAAEIPYLTTAGRGYYGRKEIQDLIHLLRVFDDPADDLALVGVLRSPLFALEDNVMMALRFRNQRTLWDGLMKGEEQDAEALVFARETLQQLYGMRSRLTVVELLRAALVATGYLATISGLRDGERRRVNVEKLVQAARLSGGRGLHTFRQYLDRLLASEVREGEAPLEAENSVRLMTVHRSKGLEFPVVVLPELGRSGPALRATWFAQAGEGLTIQLRDQAGERQRPLAMQRALAQEQLIERAERERLLYVALTRAQDFLLLSGGEAQSDGDNWLSRLLQALGYPWSAGGPPGGEFGALRVVR